jgi:cytochrome c-type biogenesis protein CcmF
MPWIVGTALVHSLAVTEKRGAFKAWTVLLAICAFSLSLLGTFLVRSGVLTSVHAFATDPTRGVFILLFLGLVIGGSLLLYSWRASQIRSSVHFGTISREMGLLLNNIILVVIACSILLGTLYPLLYDALGMGKISVGPPYFDIVFVLLSIPLVVVMGVGPLVRWRGDSGWELSRKLSLSLLLSLLLGSGLILLLAPSFSWWAAGGMVLALWVVFTTLVWIRRQGALGDITRSGWGMVLGHIGIAVFVIGVALSSNYSQEKDIRLDPGQSYNLNGYDFLFQGAREVKAANYVAAQGVVEVSQDGRQVTTLHPEKRNYKSGMPMTEAGIDAGLWRDLFVALGEPLEDSGAWSIRVYHKPFIRWIWLGGLLMSLGGLLAAMDRRYFRLARKARLAAEGAGETI